MKQQKRGRVIYLPPQYDPQKVDEGLREILYLIGLMEDKEKAKEKQANPA